LMKSPVRSSARSLEMQRMPVVGQFEM